MERTNSTDRRSFIRRVGLAALSAGIPQPPFGREVSLSVPKVRLTIDTEGPAYLEVRGSHGEMYQPCGAVMDRTANQFNEHDRYYLGHFTSEGRAVIEVPVDRYTLVAEKGLEFQRIESVVDLRGDQTVRLVPQRWVDMASKGWWSGDFHMHRPLEDASLLVTAEDLNLAVFFTMWNNYSFWEGRELPAGPVVQADSRHVVTAMNAEDERGGGAWMMHNLRKPLALSPTERWYPQGHVFVDQAEAQGAWFDCEKPFWWEVPVMAALEADRLHGDCPQSL